MDDDPLGKPPEVTIEEYDTIEMVNGTPGCAQCGCLLCVQTTARHGNGGTTPVVGNIGGILLPYPTTDTRKIQCAGCGRILWREGDQ